MGLLTELIKGISHLILIGLDLVVVFILIHLIRMRWHHGLLEALDSVGTPVVRWVSQAVRAITNKTGATPRNENNFLVVGLILLCFIRIVFSSILSIIFSSY